MDDCVDNSTWLNLLKERGRPLYFNFTQMALRAGQNDVTGRIRGSGPRAVGCRTVRYMNHYLYMVFFFTNILISSFGAELHFGHMK